MMAQHGFGQFGHGHGHGHGHNGGSIDPNDLAMSGGYSPSFSNSNNNNNNNFGSNSGSGTHGFSSGSALFGDDELLDGLGSPSDPQGMHGQSQDFSGMNSGMNMAFSQQSSFRPNSGLQLDQSHMNGYSNTPDGDPIQSPYAAGFSNQFRQMQTGHSMGTSLQSPLSYSGSPLADMNADGSDPNYLSTKARARMSQQMQRKASNARSPMTPKTNTMHGMPIGSQESPGFGPTPIRTPGMHEKSSSGQWMNNNIPASYNAGFSSPMQPGIGQINEVMMKGGTSMPAKLGANNNAVSSQEMKRKRRRESHNLVERRRRDNINERIQDLSRLVPTHRLEDEKIRKLIQNGTPLSPTLTGIPSPSQATSGLAGPGARRAASTSAGNITTGLPLEEKDKGPNKGDILNGAVSWTRDLMWMLHLKLQQHEEMMNTIAELGGHFPFEMTDDERRMQTELMDAISKSEMGTFSYSRTAGSGLRVPHHTDYRGEMTNGSSGGSIDPISISPDDHGNSAIIDDLGDGSQFWHDPNDGSGHASINFKEEDEYDMDLTQ